MIGYFDDVQCAEVPKYIHKNYSHSIDLLKDLGVPISPSKLCPPSTKMVCLGIHIDSVLQTLSIPQGKIGSIINKCQQVLSFKNISKRALQSLVGLLLFLHKAIRPARFFVNRLLDSLRTNFDKTFIKVTEEMKKDLRWFTQLCRQYNGCTKYVHVPLQQHEKVALDACLTGFGGVYGSKVYTYCLNEVVVPTSFCIAHLELWNILIACRVWGDQWTGKNVAIACDNMSAVSILNHGKTVKGSISSYS